MRPARQFLDPIGPGTPAWNSFDIALVAWINLPEGLTGKARQSHPLYRRWRNARHYMIAKLREAGASEATIDAWCQDLRSRCLSKDLAI